MSSSLFEGVVDYATTTMGDDDPISAHAALVLLNNALHFADQMAQVRVNWMLDAEQNGVGGGGDGDGYIIPETISSSVYHLIWRSGPFPVSVRADGTPYDFRVRLFGASGTGSTNVTFRMVAGPPDLLPEYASRGINNADFTTDSSTLAWIAATTDNILSVTREAASQAAETLTVPTVANSGQGANVDAVMFEIGIYATSSNGSAEPRLGGAYAAEYVGT